MASCSLLTVTETQNDLSINERHFQDVGTGTREHQVVQVVPDSDGAQWLHDTVEIVGYVARAHSQSQMCTVADSEPLCMECIDVSPPAALPVVHGGETDGQISETCCEEIPATQIEDFDSICCWDVTEGCVSRADENNHSGIPGQLNEVFHQRELSKPCNIEASKDPLQQVAVGIDGVAYPGRTCGPSNATSVVVPESDNGSACPTYSLQPLLNVRPRTLDKQCGPHSPLDGGGTSPRSFNTRSQGGRKTIDAGKDEAIVDIQKLPEVVVKTAETEVPSARKATDLFCLRPLGASVVTQRGGVSDKQDAADVVVGESCRFGGQRQGEESEAAELDFTVCDSGTIAVDVSQPPRVAGTRDAGQRCRRQGNVQQQPGTCHPGEDSNCTVPDTHTEHTINHGAPAPGDVRFLPTQCTFFAIDLTFDLHRHFAPC
jgi:hypothetical protein